MATITLNYERSSATIDTHGSYLSSLVIDGVSTLKKSNDGVQTHGGCALLIPFANRVRDATYSWGGIEYHLKKNEGNHAIHGICRDLDWDIEESAVSSVTLSCRLLNSGYPSELHVSSRFVLSGSSVSITLILKNTGKVSAPFVLGLHPYFLYSGAWRVVTGGPVRKLNVVDNYFPDGITSNVKPGALGSISHKEFDDCFRIEQTPMIDLGDHSVAIKAENFHYFQVYNGKYSEGESVAFEPMTGAPDAFNNGIGLLTISPGTEKEFHVMFALERGRNTTREP